MKWTLKKISIVLYLLSFVLPVFSIVIFQRSLVFGYWAFVMGASFIQELNIFFFCWLANIAYLTSLLIKNSKTKLITSVVAILLSFLLPIGFIVTREKSYFLHVGYFTWMLSFITNLIGVLKKNNAVAVV